MRVWIFFIELSNTFLYFVISWKITISLYGGHNLKKEVNICHSGEFRLIKNTKALKRNLF